MADLKKLYVILALLIVIYVGINFAYNGMETINSVSNFNLADAFTFGNTNTNDGISVGSSSFAEIENFTTQKISDNEVDLTDQNKNITITVKELDDSQNIEETVNNLLGNETTITSNQTITQNDITVHFLYEETVENFNADIYFSKNNKNYEISGDYISYEDSDYFINTCKEIISSIGPSGQVNYSRY